MFRRLGIEGMQGEELGQLEMRPEEGRAVLMEPSSPLRTPQPDIHRGRPSPLFVDQLLHSVFLSPGLEKSARSRDGTHFVPNGSGGLGAVAI
jgi:hypothetical protein